MQEVQRIKDRHIPIIGVGVSKNVNETELKMIATSDDYYFYVDQFSGLSEILDGLIMQSCVTIKPPPSTVPAPGK